ncbi:MAG: cytidylate kinase-like family protein [Eubacteriales bacterium]|nr:cytidylate kinase-like family protein [Eubacteriales bacterium]
MKPLVITIGCEYGARGNSIGKKIAEDLGIRFYGRDLVDEIISEVGIPNEIMDKVESGVTIAGKGVQGQERGDFSKYSDLTDRAIHVQKQIVKKLADRESCVIIGRSADYILKDRENVLRVFVYAPNETRLEYIMQKHNLSEKDAKMLIAENDKRLHQRHLALTGSNRGDRHNRDILIDSSLLGVDGTANLIETLAEKYIKKEQE